MAGEALFPNGVLIGGGRCGRGDARLGRQRQGVFEAEFQNVVRFAGFDDGEAFGEFLSVSTSSEDAGEIGHDGFALARIGGEGQKQVFFEFVGRSGDGGVHPAELAVFSSESASASFCGPRLKASWRASWGCKSAWRSILEVSSFSRSCSTWASVALSVCFCLAAGFEDPDAAASRGR
jgi:hypothetical protein